MRLTGEGRGGEGRGERGEHGLLYNMAGIIIQTLLQRIFVSKIETF